MCTYCAILLCNWAYLVAQMEKNLPTKQETQFDPWVRKIPWRRKGQPTPVFLPGKSQGQRSLEGYSLWGCKRVEHNWATNSHSLIVQSSNFIPRCLLKRNESYVHTEICLRMFIAAGTSLAVQWVSSPGNPVLLLQGVQVQPLVGELRSCKSCGVAKR